MVVTEDVVAEAVARWRDRRPTAQGAVTARMAQNLRTLCTVQEDYDPSIEWPGSDDGDRHVHAAAVACGAGYLVTGDRGFHDLPDSAKASLPYSIYGPDEFLVLVAAQSPGRFREAVRANLRYYSSKGERMSAALVVAGCPRFSQRVALELKVLAGSLTS